jgi:hypothetical protein
MLGACEPVSHGMNETTTWRQARARIASLTAGGAPAEEIEQARADFRALFAEEKIEELIKSAPELSAAQRSRLAGLLDG